MKEARVKPKPAEGEQSHYAKKRASGNMMYGPGCCAHTVTQSQIEAAKKRARERGHFEKPAFVSTFRSQQPLDYFDPTGD